MVSLTSTSTGSRRRPDPPASSEEVSFSAALARTNTKDVSKFAIHDNPHEKQDPKPHDLQGPEAANKEIPKHHVLSPRPPPKDEVELLKSRNQLKNVICNYHDHDGLLSEAKSTEIDVDELIQHKVKLEQQKQQHHQQQREPDGLAFVGDQHVSPPNTAFTCTTAMTFKEVKSVAKELNEQDKRTKDLASAVPERQPFSQVSAVHREHGHAKQPFPHRLRRPVHLAVPRLGGRLLHCSSFDSIVRGVLAL